MKRATSGRHNTVKLEVKHFFSGAAVYANGKICITLTPAGFAMKLPEGDLGKLMRKKGVKGLRYFSKGTIKKAYAVLPKSMTDNLRTVRYWAKKSIAYVASLPK